jgi:hypothetical protein
MINNAKISIHILAYFAVILMLLFLPACAGSPSAIQTPQASLPPQNLIGNQGVTKKPAYLPPPENTPGPVVFAQGNPAPLGTAVTIDNKLLKVTGIIRPADDLVAKGNMFNTSPAAGQEYVFVNLSATCKLSASETCLISDSDFKMVGSSGQSRDAETFLAGVSGLLGSGEFNGGTTKTGYVAFIVDKGKTNLILVYTPFLADQVAYMSVGQ